MAVLSVENISKSFDGTPVLRDISFSLNKGEAVSILGPSGSGKSTLLRIIAMLETMDGGRLVLGDKYAVTSDKKRVVITPPEYVREAREYIGMVFQSFNLFPHMTVLQNLTDAPIHIYGRSKAEANDEAFSLLEKFGLADRAASYPSTLSGGQQQRVSIARALALHPEVMLFDEPTSALDPELTAGILRVLLDLAAEKTTMLIVTHEIAFARNISDRVIFMDNGFIVEQGSPAEVIDNPQNKRTLDFLASFSADR